MKDSLTVLHFTDSHLNDPRLDVGRMCGRLLYIITSNVLKYKPDVLLNTGDFFDRPTNFTSKAGVAIQDVMVKITSLCARHGVAMWNLKGTGTHDGEQNNMWKPIAAGYPDLHFKLFDKVDIISDLGFNILTIPDSTIPDHHKCEVAVRTRMEELGLTSVDLALTHGMYTHHAKQVGYTVKAHDSEYYSSIIDIICFNGHIHIPSLVDVFLTGGSTDRTRQGENHPKGIHLVRIDKVKKSFTAEFIEQTDAAVFNSHDITGECPIEEVEKLIPHLDKLDHPDTYIRLHHSVTSPIRAIAKKLEGLYPDIVFDCVPNAKAMIKVNEKRVIELTRSIPEGLNPNTALSLLEDKFSRMETKFTDNHIKLFKDLNDVILSK